MGDVKPATDNYLIRRLRDLAETGRRRTFILSSEPIELVEMAADRIEASCSRGRGTGSAMDERWKEIRDELLNDESGRGRVDAVNAACQRIAALAAQLEAADALLKRAEAAQELHFQSWGAAMEARTKAVEKWLAMTTQRDELLAKNLNLRAQLAAADALADRDTEWCAVDFLAAGKCKCDPDVGACPCLMCAGKDLLARREAYRKAREQAE